MFQLRIRTERWIIHARAQLQMKNGVCCEIGVGKVIIFVKSSAAEMTLAVCVLKRLVNEDKLLNPVSELGLQAFILLATEVSRLACR